MPEEMTRLVEARDAYDYYEGHLDSKAEHTAYLTGELIDDFAIAGPAERCLGRSAALADVGVSEVSTAYLNGEARADASASGVRRSPLGRSTA